MKAVVAARVNLVTQVAEVARFSCWSRKSRNILGQKPTNKLLDCIASKGTSQPLIKVIRENSYVSFLFFRIYSRTPLIRTPKEQSKVSVLKRCPYKRGHYDDVTFMTPLTVLSVQ